MDYITQEFLKWVESHIGIIAMGLIGATIAFLLSNESLRDKCIGAIVGLGLCVALSSWAAEVFAHGTHPEVFGFFWGAIGKSTAETLLAKFHKKTVDEVDKL